MRARPCRSHWGRIGSRWVLEAAEPARRSAEGGSDAHRPPADILGVGRFAVVGDPQGAVLMLFRGIGTPPPELPAGTAGTPALAELTTTDWPAAFYETLSAGPRRRPSTWTPLAPTNAHGRRRDERRRRAVLALLSHCRGRRCGREAGHGRGGPRRPGSARGFGRGGGIVQATDRESAPLPWSVASREPNPSARFPDARRGAMPAGAISRRRVTTWTSGRTGASASG